MRRKKAAIAAGLFACAVLFSISACENFYSDQPKTYEECIAKNMQGMTNTRTRILVEKGCRTQFPKK